MSGARANRVAYARAAHVITPPTPLLSYPTQATWSPCKHHTARDLKFVPWSPCAIQMVLALEEKGQAGETKRSEWNTTSIMELDARAVKCYLICKDVPSKRCGF